ncbi:MAG: DNA topoisomerase [Clostridium sp.]|nr:DNA topoisomerase [Clostridium sp.]
MKYLFIAEKSSLMNDVKACYENHKSEIRSKIGDIDFVYLVGHVCAYYEPTDYPDWKDKQWGEIDYPMIPDVWQIKSSDDTGKKKIIADIRKRVQSIDGIIVGTDSDVEGYGIYYLLEHFLGIEHMPALRFIEHSLTDREILKSLLSMTDYHADITHKRFIQSFLLRSRADWLFGMNGTRAVTVQAGELITTGRVKAPTLKMVYDNSMAIDHFKPRKFYTLNAHYETKDGEFTAEYTEDGIHTVQFDNISDIPDVSVKGIIQSKKTERTYTNAPKLYDLAAIQSEAGGKYGYSPAKTLEILQSLYVKHKLISYPRTQCRYVSSEKAKEFPDMLKLMDVFDDLKPYAASVNQDDFERVLKDKNVVNNKEVEKESHDALLPTSNRPNLSKLSEEEKNICHMIYARLLAQFLPKLEEDKTVIIIRHDDQYDFIARGKIVINPGWRNLYSRLRDNVIPMVDEGDPIQAESVDPKEGITRPPRRLTQATLLNAMENIASQINDPVLKKAMAESKGIGTSSTRAAIISDLLNRGYIEEQKSGLYITNTGKRYIDSIKELDIISPVFAAKLDTKIKEVQRGEAEYEEVYSEIITSLRKMIRQVDGMETKVPVVNTGCPKCGTHFRTSQYSYHCPNCGFKISKQICGKNISEDMLEALCAGKTTETYTLKKKNGETFRARLKLGEEGIEFDFGSGVECPFCGNAVKINRGGLFCDCGVKLFRKMGTKAFSDSELKKLLEKGQLKKVKGFISKAGKEFTPDLILAENENGEIVIQFDTSGWGNN